MKGNSKVKDLYFTVILVVRMSAINVTLLEHRDESKYYVKQSTQGKITIVNISQKNIAIDPQ